MSISMNERFEVLDSFRGICAIAVVIFHMNLVGSISELDFFKGSDVFVEFFFVLSGFVLAHGYGFKENLNFKTFMKARFLRLYPLHFFMFLVFITLEFCKLFAYKFGGLVFNNEPFTNSSSISEIIPNLLLIQSWLPFTDHLTFNYPSWSISIEFYIYGLLFLSVYLFNNNRVLSWFMLSFIAFIIMHSDYKILEFQVLQGLTCFFGGAFTYVIYKKMSFLKPSYILGSITEVLLLICIVIVVQSKIEYRSLIAPLLFFCSVFFFAFESGVFSKLLKFDFFLRLGKLSYSIYMTHAAILFCLLSTAMVLQKITGVEVAPMVDMTRYLDFGNSSMNNLMIFLILFIVIYTSGLTYKYVELKGQNILKSK